MSDDQFVIVGASVAGARAAETLRAEGFDGSIVLVGEESEQPYERPPLSKGVLLGNDEPSVAFLHEPSWYDENRIRLMLGRTVRSIDPAAHTVTCDDGEEIGYAKLLLATGSRARRLDVPGGDLDGVHYLRSFTESQKLLGRLKEGGDVVIVGAGWIGLETAAAAREHGCDVTMIEPQPTPLHQVVGPEMGQVFTDLHTEHGVRFKFGEGVSAFSGEGRLAGVVTGSGDELAADLVVVGVGIVPNVELARDAGLEVDDGVVCDESLRTSDPDVYAAGDVATWFNPTLGHRIRVEHWANANDGGPAAARSMLGQQVAYDIVPFFFSDQYDVGLEYAGDVPREVDAELVVRGDLATREFMAFWLDADRVLAGMHFNTWDTIDAVQDLVRSRDRVDKARLADPDVPLHKVRSEGS